MKRKNLLYLLILSSLVGVGIRWKKSWGLPADPCEKGTCFSVQPITKTTVSDVTETTEQRIKMIIETWYDGKKCDFNKSLAASLGTKGLACKDTLPGATVGRICNFLADTPELTKNHNGVSCGSKCSAALSCKKSFSFKDPTTEVTETITHTLNDDPVTGCGLCNLELSKTINREEWDEFTSLSTKDALETSIANGYGSLVGASCSCCTANVNYKSCEKEASYVRGALVQTALKSLEQVKAGLSKPGAIIELPFGSSSRCFAMKEVLQKLRNDLNKKNTDLNNDTCTVPPESADELRKLLQSQALTQASCLRETVNNYINQSAALLAVCRILEDSQEMYVKLEPKIRAAITATDCSGVTSVDECIDEMDQGLMEAIKAEIQKAFP